MQANLLKFFLQTDFLYIFYLIIDLFILKVY